MFARRVKAEGKTFELFSCKLFFFFPFEIFKVTHPDLGVRVEVDLGGAFCILLSGTGKNVFLASSSALSTPCRVLKFTLFQEVPIVLTPKRLCSTLGHRAFIPVSSLSHSFVSNSLQHHGLQHARRLCPSPTPKVYSNSCPLSW